MAGFVWIALDPTMSEPGKSLMSIPFFLLMVYLFIGIALASDIFMNGIEKICGATKTVKVVKEENGVIVVTTKETQVWNETVANLTLMALGSSAPEILLSAIEISQGLGQHNPGDLGPGTIVGSAAFNLMMISAVCIVSLPTDATSRIKLYKVFAVTSLTSLFAYIWMVIVLTAHSKDQIDLWEALVTLLMFPLLVIVAYWADQDFCMSRRPRRSSVGIEENKSNDENRDFFFGDADQDNLYDADGNYDKRALANLYNKLNEMADLKPEEIVNILATKLIQGKQHNRTWYRSQMSKALMGGGKMTPVLDEKLQEVVEVLGSEESTNKATIRKSMIKGTSKMSVDTIKRKALVEFQAATLAVSESIGEVKVIINRTGKEDVGFQVVVDTADGTAKKGKEYQAMLETITFEPYVKEMTVSVKIIDNVQWNPDSNFFIRLAIPAEMEEKVALGTMRVVEIIIEDDDKPGKLSFDKRGYVFKDSVMRANVEVIRKEGSDGVVSVSWKAVPGPNCKLVAGGTAGSLEFQHGEMKKFIEVPFQVHQGKVEGQEETFELVLFDPKGGAKLGKIPKTTCAISSDENFKLEINNVVSAALQLAADAEEDLSYKDQILQAVMVNGGDVANASAKDWCLHILTFPLKFACSLIPPAHVCGGWLCFIFALMVIGLLTKLVGDTASAFGLALGIDPTITAITFVALGTSLPDTFASRIAAMNDKTADNAIGNVTGSNSVNVFLGLGVPWTIGALYYMIAHDDSADVESMGLRGVFCVPAGTLMLNVIVFSVTAFVALGILTFRRYSKQCGEAELGGPSSSKWITAVTMIILWVVYIAVSSVIAQQESHSKEDKEMSKCEVLVRTRRLLADLNHEHK